MKRILIAIAIILALAVSAIGVYAVTSGHHGNGSGCPMMQSGQAGSGCPMMQSDCKDMSKCDMMKSGSCPMHGTTAVAKGTTSAVCPVMGRKIPNVAKAAGKSVYKGKAYYFCCPSCKTKFDKNPSKYVKPVVAPKTISAVCPVMGTKIADVSKAAGKSVYKGKTYYFCCPGCKPAFDDNPAKYAK